jgi:DNA-binding response OmpR family regulator
MGNGKKILVVDDNPDVGEFCKTVLEPKGYAVAHVESAQAAQAAMRKDAPDLLIVDVMMEEIDSGFKFVEKLAKAPKKPPILMLTSLADATAQSMDTAALPVNELLQKPIKPQDLLAKVEQVLGKRAG